jgi:hypothetical protein
MSDQGGLRDTRHFAATAWRRPALAGLALLAALVCLATTAAARADFATRTRALHATINAAPPATAMVTGSADWGAFTQSIGTQPRWIAYAGARIRERLAAALPLAEPDTTSWSELAVPGRAVLAPPSAFEAGAVGARVRLVYRDTLQTESRLLAGSRPTEAAQNTNSPLEADLSAATAARLGLRLGDLLTIKSADLSGTTVLRIVGLVTALDPGSAFWASDKTLMNPQLESDSPEHLFWATDALIGSAQVAALTAPSASGALPPPADFQLSWTFPLDLSGLDADGAAPLADRLDTLAGIQDALAYGPSDAIPVTLTTQLTPILRAFAAALQVTALEQSMPVYGLALIAAIAGALLTYAAVDRRRAETGVLRARGAATWYLVRQAFAESVVTALPAGVVGFALGNAVPGRTPSWLTSVVAVVVVSATLAPALCTALVYRPRRAARAPSTTRRPSRIARQRRLIVHGALAAACLAGIDLIRGQGLAPGGSVDPYAAAAPVLAATLAALVTVNVLPLALRALRRRALPRRGIVALLGVARAAHEPGTGQAATFVLTTAACTADLSVALARLARQAGSGPLGTAAASTLNALAVLAVVAACAVAALAVRLGAASRRSADRRLATMGLTTGQARAIAAMENAPPALAGALTGALVTVPLLRIVAPALGVAAVPASAGSLALPALAVALPAAAAGVAGSWRRGTP